MAHKYKILSGSVLLALLGYATYSIASPNNLERSYTLATSALLPKTTDDISNDVELNNNIGEDEKTKPSPIEAKELPEEEEEEQHDEPQEEEETVELPAPAEEEPLQEKKDAPVIQSQPEEKEPEEKPAAEIPEEVIVVETKDQATPKENIMETPEIKVVEQTEPIAPKEPKETKEPEKETKPKADKKPTAKPRNPITTNRPKRKKQREIPKGQKSTTHSSGTGKSGTPISISGNPESVKLYKKNKFFVGNQWDKDLLDTSNPRWWTVNEEHIITNGTVDHFKTDELKEIYRELKDKSKENLDGNRLMNWCKSKYKHIYKDIVDPIADDIWFACRLRKSVETASTAAILSTKN